MQWLTIALVWLAPGCAIMGDRGQALVPTRYQVRTGPFLIYSNTPIPANSPSVQCLQSLQCDLSAKLAYRPRSDEDPVEIYVLADRNAYAHFLKFYYPELPPRRAFFLAQESRRVIYTYQSNRLEEDLRHEATHALVRGCYGDLPLWLDEGLAEYFETPVDAIDAQHEHLARIPEDLKGGWVPDLSHLESLTGIHQMSPRDYREAWAWVHLMLSNELPGSSPLLDYLKEGRNGPAAQSLAQIVKARGATSKTLVAHIQTLQSRVVARKPEPPSQEQFVRLQDRVAESPVATNSVPPRVSFLRRLGSWLGF
jgi:hypothetical protein